jgi:hypothetical protein
MFRRFLSWFVNPDNHEELLHDAWAIISNAGGGNWERESAQWRHAAKQWRERYFDALTRDR